MDNYTKSILTIIAILLLGILFKGNILTEAYAVMDIGDYSMVDSRLRDIASAIRGCN